MIHMTRKTAVTSFVVLCALALAIPAAAQVSFNVTSSAQTVRTEGQTETAGSVNMNWASGTAISAGSSITLTYATATVLPNSPYVTAKIGGATCLPTQGNPSVAGTGNCSNMTVTTSGASVVISFSGGPTPSVAAAFVAGDYIQVAQTRLNIAGVTGAQLVSGTTPLAATISGNSPSANTITFNQNQVTVASISNSLNVAKGTTVAIATCAVPTPPPAGSFSVKATEVFPAAFTTAGDENLYTPNFAGAPGSLTGVTVNFVFYNVPPGLTIAPVAGAGFYTGSTAGFTVGTVTGSQTSASAATPLTFSATVTADNTSSVEAAIFNFTLGASSSTVTALAANGLTSPLSITAQAYLGPVTNTAATVVRFTQLLYPAAPFTVATISDCVTNLLFPYHNAANGFDTSYSFANTTSDAFAFGAPGLAKPVSGTCKLTLFTSDLAGNATGTATLTTPIVATGGVVAFSSASGGGGVPAGTPLDNQAGYVIAVCNFLDAHAYALVTNGNASVVPTGQQYATGYLGLVLGAARTLNESLGH